MSSVEPHSLPPNQLGARRQALRLSQNALGRELDVTGNTIARREHGQQRLANPGLVELAVERVELGGRTDGGLVEQLLSPTAPGRPCRRSPAHNLPAALTSFVGRRQDVRRLCRQLDTARLVTVSGAAGIGKTRLSLEVARKLAGRFPDRVWLVELAPVEQPGLLAQRRRCAARPRRAGWLATTEPNTVPLARSPAHGHGGTGAGGPASARPWRRAHSRGGQAPAHADQRTPRLPRAYRVASSGA
jgi:hypothetical protein